MPIPAKLCSTGLPALPENVETSVISTGKFFTTTDSCAGALGIPSQPSANSADCTLSKADGWFKLNGVGSGKVVLLAFSDVTSAAQVDLAGDCCVVADTGIDNVVEISGTFSDGTELTFTVDGTCPLEAKCVDEGVTPLVYHEVLNLTRYGTHLTYRCPFGWEFENKTHSAPTVPEMSTLCQWDGTWTMAQLPQCKSMPSTFVKGGIVC